MRDFIVAWQEEIQEIREKEKELNSGQNELFKQVKVNNETLDTKSNCIKTIELKIENQSSVLNQVNQDLDEINVSFFFSLNVLGEN